MGQCDSTGKNLQPEQPQIKRIVPLVNDKESAKTCRKIDTWTIVLEEDFVKEEMVLCSDEELMEVKKHEDKEQIKELNSFKKCIRTESKKIHSKNPDMRRKG